MPRDDQKISDSSQILATLTAVGAVSPETSRAGADLPILDPQILRELVQLGKVHEPSPGRFYVAAQPARSPSSFLKTVLFWILLIAVPVILIRLSQ